MSITSNSEFWIYDTQVNYKKKQTLVNDGKTYVNKICD